MVKTSRKVIFRGLLLSCILVIALFFIDVGLEVVKQRPRIRVSTDYYHNVMAFDRVVALTFDDGPDPEMTLPILDILKQHQVPATFFFTGSQALKYPEIVKAVHESGYEIGIHSFSHSPNVHESKNRLRYELDVTNKIIGNITGQQTLLYRPPFLLDIGTDPLPDPHQHSPVLDWAMDLGYLPIGADIDSFDWRASSSIEVTTNVISNLDNGHIVLLHDGGQGIHTVNALDQLITELKARNYRFETVSDIIGLNSAESMRVTKDLHIGMSDEASAGEVTKLQTFLLREGLFDRVPTGYFGPITQQAVLAFQNANDISQANGVVDHKTRELIDTSLSATIEIPGWITHFGNPRLIMTELWFQQQSVMLLALSVHHIPLVTKFTLFFVIVKLLAVSMLLWFPMLSKKNTQKTWRAGVSIIVPAYNEAENITASIGSLLKTKHKKYEIIVIDDGSTDNTRQLVEAIQKKHPKRIRLYSQQNAGKAAALNTGLHKAKYDIVIAIDGDSIFTPETVAYLGNHFSDPSVGAVAGKVNATNSRNLIAFFQQLEYVVSQNIDKEALNAINAIGVVPGPVGAWRKSLLLKLNGYSADTLVEDQDMTLAVLAAGKRIVYEPRAIAYTETPFTVTDFVKQRVRWVYGTMQCLVKYKRYMFNPFSGSLGLVVLPHTLIYSVFLPLLYPLMEILLISWVVFNIFNQVWPLLAIFFLIEWFYALFAFVQEDSKKLLFLFPFQRLFYRVVLYYVILISLGRILEGGELLWKRVIKRGEAQKHYFGLAQN